MNNSSTIKKLQQCSPDLLWTKMVIVASLALLFCVGYPCTIASAEDRIETKDGPIIPPD